MAACQNRTPRSQHNGCFLSQSTSGGIMATKNYWFLMAAINLSAYCLSACGFERKTHLIYSSYSDREDAIVRLAENVCHQGSVLGEHQCNECLPGSKRDPKHWLSFTAMEHTCLSPKAAEIYTHCCESCE